LFGIDIPPLLILIVGIATVLGLILALRTNAFLALIVAALVVSMLAPGDVELKVKRVAMAFGTAAGNIGIVIALAAIIGQCMMESGAADRIVRSFLNALGEKRAGVALMSSGYVLAVPVFFDTVFYLLVPLARSLYKRTGKNFILYIMAIAAGGAVTHSLVPPTPGPLLMADNLKVDLGVMILIGGLIAVPTSLVGLLVASLMNRYMPIPMRDFPGTGEQSVEPTPETRSPGLFVSFLPIILPVILISLNTGLSTWAKGSQASVYAKVIGDPSFALLISAVIAMGQLVYVRGLTLRQLEKTVELSLMSGGVIILITAAGGAFGAMLKEAQIGPAIQGLFGTAQASGLMLLTLGFGIATLLKIAQGSGTVSMITSSAMLAAMLPTEGSIGFDAVYLATAIGGGSMVGSWMNDSGFWIVSKMSCLTEVETLRTWTILLVFLGLTAFLVSLGLAIVLPFPLGSPG